MSIALLALAILQVDGLRAGESLVSVAKTDLVRSSGYGRVIDGVTGAPVAGAKIEMWAEHSGLTPELLLETSSRIDGTFFDEPPTSAQSERGKARHVDKVIVRAPGYRATCTSGGDAAEILLLPLAKHLSLRVTDLDGKPIAGARAESRQTCAHAPPAFVATGNAKGAFELSTFPPLDDNPEIVVGAPGYGSVFLGFADPVLANHGLEVRLPRRRPLAFHLVDTQGSPIVERRVGFGVEPNWCVRTSDVDGRVVWDSPFFGRQFVLTLDKNDKEEFVEGGRAPSALEPRIVFLPGAEDPQVDANPDSLVPVHVVDENQRPLDLEVGVLRESGSTRFGLEGVKSLGKDWGRMTLVAGGPFTGWKETVKALEAPVETTLVVTREPVLTIVLPEEKYWLVHVQAGDDSITLEWSRKSTFRQPVPAGKAITICAVGNEETRLAPLGHIDEDRTVDMTRTSSVLEQNRVAEAPVVHRWLVDEPELSGHVRLASGQIDWSVVDGAVEFQAPPKENFEAILGAKDCVPRAVGPWNAGEAKLTLRHRASLAVHGAALTAVYAGGDQAEADADEVFRVSDLAPGPLLAEIVRANGEIVTVSLVLGDGEHRELTVR